MSNKGYYYYGYLRFYETILLCFYVMIRKWIAFSSGSNLVTPLACVHEHTDYYTTQGSHVLHILLKAFDSVNYWILF